MELPLKFLTVFSILFLQQKKSGKVPEWAFQLFMALSKVMGGGVSVNSDPGKGTTVRVLLPISSDKIPNPDFDSLIIQSKVGMDTELVNENETPPATI